MTAASITPTEYFNAISAKRVLIAAGADVSTNVFEITAAGTLVFSIGTDGTPSIVTGDLAIGDDLAVTGDLTVTAATALNGTIALSGQVTIADSVNIALNTGTGTKIGTATGQKLAFYNTTPVAQQSTTGTSSGFTAGGGTTATSTSTFTGGTGTAAYTTGDIVKALKAYGLLAA